MQFGAQRPELAGSVLHTALLQKQADLNAQIDNFVFVQVSVLYDGMFEVSLHTFESDNGSFESYDLDEAFRVAAEMLIGMRNARLAYLEGRDWPRSAFLPPSLKR